MKNKSKWLIRFTFFKVKLSWLVYINFQVGENSHSYLFLCVEGMTEGLSSKVLLIDIILCGKIVWLLTLYLSLFHYSNKLRLKCAVQSWVWAMARDPIFWGFEPWLGKPSEPWLRNPFFEVWAMARDPYFGGFEPWLKAPFLGGLSHGSGTPFLGVWAMAQDPIFGGFEPWLKTH